MQRIAPFKFLPMASGKNIKAITRLSARTKLIITAIFAVIWAGVQIHQQIRFAQDPAQQGVQQAGDYVQMLVPATGFVGSLVIGDINGALQFAAGCATTAGVTTILKQSIDSPRPNGDPHSFPSGHTAFTFQGAAFITRRYGWRLGILALLLACFVGYSRVEAEKHWPRDVVVGAVIGIAAGAAFTKPFGPKTLPGNSKDQNGIRTDADI